MEEVSAPAIERPVDVDGLVSMKRVLMVSNLVTNWSADKCMWCFQVSGLGILYTDFFFCRHLINSH